MTNPQKLLEAFKKGERLNSNSAFRKHKVLSFSESISSLKRQGFNIIKEEIARGKNNKPIHEWYMEKENNANT